MASFFLKFHLAPAAVIDYMYIVGRLLHSRAMGMHDNMKLMSFHSHVITSPQIDRKYVIIRLIVLNHLWLPIWTIVIYSSFSVVDMGHLIECVYFFFYSTCLAFVIEKKLSEAIDKQDISEITSQIHFF
ncbi:hypothetical protein ACJX0J_016685 [Zea mays]